MKKILVALISLFTLSSAAESHDKLIREFMHTLEIDRVNTLNIAVSHKNWLDDQKKKCPSCRININSRLKNFVAFMEPQVNYTNLNKKLFYIFKKHFSSNDVTAFVNSHANLDYHQKWQELIKSKGKNEKFINEYVSALYNFSSNDRLTRSVIVDFITHEGGEQIIKEYIRKAKKGSRKSLHMLCYSYKYGKNTQMDLDKAVKWCKKGNEQSISSSTVMLAEIYYDSNIKKYHDLEKAMKLYEKAAARGHSHAQFLLGIHLFKGEHMGQNKKEALKWLKKAEKNGNQGASLFISKNY